LLAPERGRVIPLTSSLIDVPLDQQSEARVRVVPERPVANSWEDAADLSAALGVPLDPWQEDVLEAALGERHGGMWAAQQVGLSAPRQNGKSQIIVARILVGALLFGERKIVVSAHQKDTARETFGKFIEIYDQSPALRKRVRAIHTSMEREAIFFHNGAQVQFKARTASGPRGLSADCLLLDEAQILSRRTWSSINSTMSARKNPQVWLMGTPPTPDDDGEVFGNIRAAAIEGRAKNLAYLEWSAEVGDDPTDERVRWKANPAWSQRINHEVVEGEFQTYTKAEFARERLGIWDIDSPRALIKSSVWDELVADTLPIDGIVAVGVKFSADGERISVGLAVNPDDGPVCVASLGVAPMASGVGQALEWIVQRWPAIDQIVLDGLSGAGEAKLSLREAGVPAKRVKVLTTPEAVTAHAGFLRDVHESNMRHAGQPGLDVQVRHAMRRSIGTNGGWGWKPTAATHDVTALDAVTLARHGAVTTNRKRTKTAQRRGREAIVA
jgi:hypothetical protein